MNHQTQSILNAITATISDIFHGNFAHICEVKKAVLHLQAIYFCRSTCHLLHWEDLTLETQLALYQENEMIPQKTIVFFEDNRECILDNWPAENALAEKPEMLYEALLSSELCIRPDKISYKTDKVSRDIAGAYYTSSDFSKRITHRALETYLNPQKDTAICSNPPISGSALNDMAFLDYSCGCGEFLLAVIQYFIENIPEYSVKRLATQLKGVDVNPIALMITVTRIVSSVEAEVNIDLLRNVAKNFIVGNPLLYNENTAPLEKRFDNFALNRLYAETEGINCLELVQQNLIVLGNPPWEKLRFEERAFFRPLCPEISAVSQKNKRSNKINKLTVDWPELFEYYTLLQHDYMMAKRAISRHPFLNKSLVGELNTYALFAELASRLTEKDGFAAIIVKSALVTSTCYSSCFRYFVSEGLLSEVFLYDNRERIFQIDSREKFCVLFFGGIQQRCLKVHYGLAKSDQITSSTPLCVTIEELELVNPETGLLPNVTDADEFSFLLRAHSALPVFAEEFPQCHYGRLVHLTAHSNYISTRPSEMRIPIYEGKFIEQYDNRFSTFAGMTDGERYQAKASAKRQNGDGFIEQKPAPECRYFIDKTFWETFLERYDQEYSLCWRSLTSPTNQRTMIATIIPSMPTCQSIQLLQVSSTEDLMLILALFNSKVFDYFVRLKMAGIDLTQSVVRQIPVPSSEVWKSQVNLCGVDYMASDAVKVLEKLLYRNEPDLAGLWDGVPDIVDSEKHFQSASDVREEIDKIIIKLYGLTSAEEKLVRSSFSV